MGSIAENVAEVRRRMARAAREAGRDPAEVKLVAATKMNDALRVRQAVAAGVDACGENRVQELTEKAAAGAYAGAGLHFIGHLQKNKVKFVVGAAELIQSADSPALLLAIARQAEKRGLTQDVLLEVNIGGETSKSGVAPAALPALLDVAAGLACVRVRGLMAIPPLAALPGENRSCFARMYELFVDIRGKKYDNIQMTELSMGMSGDFEDAIREGATMVRVGTAIFGHRNYDRQEEPRDGSFG